MAKIMIESNLINISTKEKISLKTKAIKIDNKIKFKEKDTTVEIILNEKSIQMNRKTKEALFEFYFCQGNSYCKCHVNSLNCILKLNILVNEFLIEENGFKIVYQIEEKDKFRFEFIIVEETSDSYGNRNIK